MRKSFAISAATALILLFLLASFAASLENPFYVYGDVSDSTGAPVPAGVTVTVRDVTAGGEVIDQTDADGHYQIDVSPIPDSADGNSFTCSASYADETGSCSFTLDLTKPSQPCDIGLSEAAPLIAIKAGDGSDLPDSIPVGETFTVLITEDDISVGAGTSVAFRLPCDTGDPTLDTTDADGKAQYLPENTGTLGIRVLDDTGTTVAEENVTVASPPGIQTLGSITISPDSPDPLNIGGSLTFTAVCKDTAGAEMTCPTLTWDSSNEYAGTITDTGLFEALHMGRTEIYAANGGVSSNKVWVTVNAPSVNMSVTGTNFTVPALGDDISVIGNFTTDITGEFVNATPLGNATDPDYVGTTLGLGGNIPIKGVNMEVSQHILDEMAAGNGSIFIELCYNDTELAAWGINPSTLAMYRYDGANWVKMVKDVDPCVDTGITGNCVWIEVNNLSTFALVGTKTTPRRGGGGGGGGATYPPGWGTTPAVTATAAHGATPGATAAPTGKYVTPTPKKPVTAGTAATAAEGATAGAAAKKKTPGFEAVFAIAGLLAIAYVLMRRRD